MFSQKVSYEFLLHGALHGYFLYLVCAPPEKTHKALRTRRRLFTKRFDHGSHSIIFLFWSLSQLDDVGAGKLREMLALHSNRHAVHGRFTLKDGKDDCERQVWNAVAAS